MIEAIKDDSLRKIEKERKMLAEKTILTAAKLIAPVIESSFAVGFDWCIERVKESMYSELASELEITKALTYLRQNEVSKASKAIMLCAWLGGYFSINTAFACNIRPLRPSRTVARRTAKWLALQLPTSHLFTSWYVGVFGNIVLVAMNKSVQYYNYFHIL